MRLRDIRSATQIYAVHKRYNQNWSPGLLVVEPGCLPGSLKTKN